MAKDANAKNIRITPEAYYKLAVASALVGETKSAYASRAILAAAERDLPEGWPGPGGPKSRPKPRPKREPKPGKKG